MVEEDGNQLSDNVASATPNPRKRVALVTPELDQSEHEQVSQSPRTEFELCSNCQKLDIDSMFTRKRFYEMGSVRHVLLEKVFCPLCKYIAERITTAHSHLNVQKEIFKAKVNYSIRSFLDDHDSQTNAEPYYTVAVELHGHPTKFKAISFTVADAFSRASKKTRKTHWIRQPLRSSIDISQLRTWLDRCDKSHAHCILSQEVRASIRRSLVTKAVFG